MTNPKGFSAKKLQELSEAAEWHTWNNRLEIEASTVFMCSLLLSLPSVGHQNLAGWVVGCLPQFQVSVWRLGLRLCVWSGLR